LEKSAYLCEKRVEWVRGDEVDPAHRSWRRRFTGSLHKISGMRLKVIIVI